MNLFPSRLCSLILLIPAIGAPAQTSADTARINSIYRTASGFESTNLDSAMAYYAKGFKMSEVVKYENGIGQGYYGLGYGHFLKGQYSLAIEELFKALRIFEKTGNDNTVFCMQYIAMAYNEQKIYDKALQYAGSSLGMARELKNKYCEGTSLMLIGSIYYFQRQTDSTLRYFLLGLSVMEEVGRKQGIADALNNVAIVYHQNRQLDKSLEYHFRGLTLAEEIKDKAGIAKSYHNIALIYKDKHDFKNAISYLERGLGSAKEIDAKFQVMEAYRSLSEVYAAMKKFDQAYSHHLLFAGYQDSLLNEESKKQFAEMNAKYETGKKETQIVLMQKEKEKLELITREKHRKQETIIWSVVAGLLAITGFAVYVLRSLRITRKQKYIIELQKSEVERQKKIVDEHQKEILDSIQYAKRIQTSLLPTEKYIERVLGKRN